MKNKYLMFVLGLGIFLSVGFADAAATYFDGNSGGNMYVDTSTGAIGIGSSTPKATWQITATSTNATTTLEIGKSGQTKGSCIKMYRYDGTAVYLTVTNVNVLVVSTTACLTGF